MKLVVAHSKDKHALEVADTATGAELQRLVEMQTGIGPANQKLIFKGKSIDPGATLKSLKIKSGSKIMLIGKKPVDEAVAALNASLAKERVDVARIEAELGDTGEIGKPLKDLKRGFLAEVEEEARKKINKSLLRSSVELERVLERLDILPLDRSHTEVRASRKIIIGKVQQLLEKVDAMLDELK